MNPATMLRYAAEAATNKDAPPGSPYLYALGCAYMMSPEDLPASDWLEQLFYDQARAEEGDGVNGDEILTALSMAGGAE